MQQILSALEESGQVDNTLVVFVSDNGGTNRNRDNNYPFFGNKGDNFEGSLRTPLLMRWPDEIKAGLKLDSIVMNTDLMPTLLQAAGVVEEQGLDGRSLWPLISGSEELLAESRSWEQYLWGIDANTFGFLSEDGRWRLSNQLGLSPGLYDLKTDPSGSENIADGNEQQVTSQGVAY